MDRGRPTDYRPEYCEQATKLCMISATNEELADFFNICTTTLTNWMNEHPDFMAAVKEGRVYADANVGKRLYERAMGYEHDDVDIRVCDHEIVETPIRKYYPPDSTAGIFWMKNRRPRDWRDKHEVDNTHRYPDKITVNFTDSDDDSERSGS